MPVATLRDGGKVVVTDFTGLVGTWKLAFGGRACTYRLGVVTH